ncbi:MAG: hypothetical protein SFU98_04430 [Leptospiraceae bacterium]|nr:hypothetical protein [Leptospiraceae bacterium]
MKYIFYLFVSILFSSCDNGPFKNKNFENVRKTSAPVISTLFNSRMLLLVKGTYATDNPLTFNETNGGTGAIHQDTQGTDNDPNFDLTGLPSASNLPIFIDFGEIRISSKTDKLNLEAIQNLRDSIRFWDYIAPERQVYCTTAYTIFSTNSCFRQGGISRMQEFFDGNGAKYPSNDPSSDARGNAITNSGSQYYHVGVYVRNFVTGWARENNANKINTRFDNFEVIGSNIVPRNSFTPSTTQSDKSFRTPLMFPVFYSVLKENQNGGFTNDDMNIRPGYDPYILEVRMNIKENLMVHSWRNFQGVVQTMVGFSDWSNPHTGQIDMGGNLLLRARVIYPEYAGSVFITGGTQTLRHYYSIYGKFEKSIPGNLPYAASPVRNGTTKIKYIGPGDYALYCMADTTPADGYPETIVRKIEFQVLPNQYRPQINLNLACP